MERIVGKRAVTKGDKNYPPKSWRNSGSHCADNGYVLIFVLWAVVILGFVASNFSGTTRNIIKLEKVTVERTKNLYAVRGAIIYAVNKVAGVSGKEDEDEDEKLGEFDEGEGEEEGDEGEEDLEMSPIPKAPRKNLLPKKRRGKDNTALQAAEETKGTGGADEKEAGIQQPPWVPSLTPYSVFVGDRECKVYIEDESGKIDINIIDDRTRELLVRYFIAQEFDRVEADIITDSILDWKDNDDLNHLNGAETAYYKSLQEPYEAKNAPFDSVEELALVKGMTPAKFDKVRNDITTYGHRLAININFASREALMAIPRVTPEGADYIIAERTEKGPLKSMEDIRSLFWHLGVAGSSFEEIRPYITVDNSGYMTIRATCEANGVSSSYSAIVRKTGDKVNVFAVYPY